MDWSLLIWTLSVFSILVLTSHVGSVLAILSSRWMLFRPGMRRIDDKFEAAQTAMAELGDYLSTLQRGVSDEQRSLAKAADEHQRYKTLAGTEREKAAAFLSELGLTMQAGARRERLWSIAISLGANIFVFVVGVIFSDTVKHSWLWLTGSKP